MAAVTPKVGTARRRVRVRRRSAMDEGGGAVLSVDMGMGLTLATVDQLGWFRDVCPKRGARSEVRRRSFADVKSN